MREWNEELPPAAQPRLDYMAPEYILTMSCDTASDMFSLGMLMYSVMNRGKPLYECNDNMRTYKKNCEQVSLCKRPLGLYYIVPECIPTMSCDTSTG